jgi:hypothetical protein
MVRRRACYYLPKCTRTKGTRDTANTVPRTTKISSSLSLSIVPILPPMRSNAPRGLFFSPPVQGDMLRLAPGAATAKKSPEAFRLRGFPKHTAGLRGKGGTVGWVAGDNAPQGLLVPLGMVQKPRATGAPRR